MDAPSDDQLDVESYLPPLFQKLWQPPGMGLRPGPPSLSAQRLHVYNVHENELYEVDSRDNSGESSAPWPTSSVFEGLVHEGGPAETEARALFDAAEDALHSLEENALTTLRKMLCSDLEPLTPDGTICDASGDCAAAAPTEHHISFDNFAQLRRYLVFIRFRNSAGYVALVRRLHASPSGYGYASWRYAARASGTKTSTPGVAGWATKAPNAAAVFEGFKAGLIRAKRIYILKCFIAFLTDNTSTSSPASSPALGTAGSHLEPDSANLNHIHQLQHDLEPYYDLRTSQAEKSKFVDVVREIMDAYCWRLLDAELCVGVAASGQDAEFILPSCGYGSLDNGTDSEESDHCDFFFPLSPRIAVYLLGTSDGSLSDTMAIPISHEQSIDVHLRNALVLHAYPSKLIFASLRSISLAVSAYYEFRAAGEHHDYSRLRMRCRQRFLVQGVMKTLVIRGNTAVIEPALNRHVPEVEEDEVGVRVFDLTETVVLQGEWAVAFGTFSDVWKGMWKDPVEKREREVAIKFLRLAMVKNVKERLIKKLQAEVATWNRLCHRNVSQFMGIVQNSSTFGMVAPWYPNGMLPSYVRSNPKADRLRLLIQVASGIYHLHSLNPPIVHGDLKGANVLVDKYGMAVITDFGLSKVMEETWTGSGNCVTGRGTSVFAGSTRWMAPELIMALAEDEGQDAAGPVITTTSDVYAFANVCLEMATDALPYAHRRTDHAVTLDLIRGILPRRNESVCLVQCADVNRFWQLLERCWTCDVWQRPSMLEAWRWLDGLRVAKF